MRLRIAARHSDLARLQAYRVGEALKQVEPKLEIEFQFRASLGDLNQTDPLWKMPEKGVFTEDFLQDLIQNKTDLVVHSWKDLPVEPRTNTEIIATLKRADQRDLFLFKSRNLDQVRTSRRLKILTSSPRRSYNLEGFFKNHFPCELNEVEFISVRGNIPTRMQKLIEQDVDGLIVAKAAIDRLLEAHEEEFRAVQHRLRGYIEQCNWMTLPLSINPTAAAQAALAIEILQTRSDLKPLLEKINCSETFSAVEDERQILKQYGGGCHQKIGVSILPRAFGRVLSLQGMTDQGKKLSEFGLVDSIQKKSASKNIWPASPANQFFKREALPIDLNAVLKNYDAIYIARETAVPENFNDFHGKIVFSSGIKTWNKLARRGVWVHASSDGLGEDEPLCLPKWLIDKEISWAKLTHADGQKSKFADNIATYRLLKADNSPDLQGVTDFFWMSGSSFDRALELCPEIENANHAAGPGHTLTHIKERLGTKGKVEVFLNYETWLELFRGEKS